MENNDFKSRKELDAFVIFCVNNPELRFWQALASWSKIAHLVAMSQFDYEMFNQDYLRKNNVKLQDTYYFE